MKSFLLVLLGILTFLDVARGVPCEKIISKYLDSVYKASDVNGDGIVDTQDRYTMAMDFDPDGDNLVSLEEVKAGVHRHYPFLLDVVDNFYNDIGHGMGSISGFDLLNYLAKMDGNGDGLSTKQESDTFWREVFGRVFRQAGVKPEGCTW